MSKENKQASDIMSKVGQSEQDSMRLRDKWIEYYKLYRNWRDQTGLSGRSNVGIPLAFEWIEVVRSRLFDIHFGKRPYVRTKGREPNDDLGARVLEHYQNYQYEIADYRNLGYDLLTQTLIYGTGIAKVFWKFEEQNKMVNEPIFPGFPEAGSVPKERKVTTYDNIGFDLVDVFDFFVDPEATNIEDAEWVAHKTRRTLSYLKEMEDRGIYKNIKEVQQGMEEDQKEGGTETEVHKQERLNIEGHLADKNNMLKPIEIIEYWTNEKVVTIANSTIVIRDQKNPYKHGRKPFIASKVISTPHEFYGIGLIEAGAPSAKVMESLLNNGLDNINFSTSPMIGIDSTRIDDTELITRPGGFFHTTGDPRNALFPMVIPDVSTGIMKWFGLMNDIARRGTGVNDYLIGQNNPDTATEATIAANEASKRIGMHIKVFGMTLTGPLAKMVFDLSSQFITAPQVIRVTGMDDAFPYGIAEISPDLYNANVDFLWENEDREMNNMLAVQQLMQMLGIAQTHPILAQFVPIIFEKVLEKYDMHENAELKQAAIFAKEMAPAYQALVLRQMQANVQSASAGPGGGVGNAPKVTGGSASNVKASADTQANPSLGNASV